jgi:hypothetical protein
MPESVTREQMERQVAEEFPIDLWPTVAGMKTIRDALVTARLRVKEQGSLLIALEKSDSDTIHRRDDEIEKFRAEILWFNEHQKMTDQLTAFRNREEKGLREAFEAGWTTYINSPEFLTHSELGEYFETRLNEFLNSRKEKGE